MLREEPADRVPEPREEHREAAEQLVAGAAEVDAQQERDADARRAGCPRAASRARRSS